MSRSNFNPPFQVADAMTATMHAYHDAVAVCKQANTSLHGRASTQEDFLSSFELFFGQRCKSLFARAQLAHQQVSP